MNTLNSMIIVQRDDFQELLDKVRELTRAIEMVNLAPKSPWVRLSEYAAKVGKTEKTVRNWIREGRVESRRQGTALMIKAF